MAKTFNCVACGRPLIFQGSTTQTCLHCGANIIVPAQVFQDMKPVEPVAAEARLPGMQSAYTFPETGMDATAKSQLLSELGRLLHQEQKLQAIKVFREATGSSLADSLETINRLETGDTSLFNDLTDSVGSKDPNRAVNVNRPNYLVSFLIYIFILGLTVLGVLIFIVD